MATAERLVLITDKEGQDALEHAEGVRVAQWISPRVALVVASQLRLRQLKRAPGVEVIEDELPENVLERLDPTETLFARAWRRRQTDAPKSRRGDRLPWDAPGFEPPDGDDGR
jgi:hypothetical protein